MMLTIFMALFSITHLNAVTFTQLGSPGHELIIQQLIIDKAAQTLGRLARTCKTMRTKISQVHDNCISNHPHTKQGQDPRSTAIELDLIWWVAHNKSFFGPIDVETKFYHEQELYEPSRDKDVIEMCDMLIDVQWAYKPFLHQAVIHNRLRLAKMFIAWGANVNLLEDAIKLSPLQRALIGKHLAMAELLVASGAKTDNHSTIHTPRIYSTLFSMLMQHPAQTEDEQQAMIRLMKKFVKGEDELTYKNSAGKSAKDYMNENNNWITGHLSNHLSSLQFPQARFGGALQVREYNEGQNWTTIQCAIQ